MSEITLALEHPSLGCGEIIARYDLSEIQEKAYQQGRADALSETVIPLSNLAQHEKQIRADAIDEFAKLIHQDLYQLNHHQVDFLAKKLKEQNNEKG